MSATLRRLLAMEPVAVQGVVRLAFMLLATLGVTVSDEVSGQVLAAIAAAYALLEAATTLLARSKATPDAKVVAVVDPDGSIVAGPASPLPDGTVVNPGLTDAEKDSLVLGSLLLPPEHPARPVISDVIRQSHSLS